MQTHLHHLQSQQRHGSGQQQGRPYRTKIKLKKNKKNIPQIHIKLDEMLSEAFTQINSQPQKKILIGSPDVVVLPNELIREYISNVYEQYDIKDPIKKNEQMYRSYSANPYNQVQRKLFETPKRIRQERELTDKSTQIKKNRSKTIQKLKKMKKKFKEELDDGTITKQKQNLEKSEKYETKINYHDFMKAKKYKKRYCLVCEQVIMDSIIDSHEKQCTQLQELLKDKNLTIQKVLMILNDKIGKLNRQIKEDNTNITQGIHILQDTINTMLTSVNQINHSIQELFQNLRILKCWQRIDKLEWFKKMKSNAQNKLSIHK